MHLVYFSSSTIPSQTANSIHVMKMCQAFVRNGHSVTLIAQKPFNSPKTDNYYDYYGVSNCFKIIRIPRAGVRGGGIYPIRALRYLIKEKPDMVYGRDATSCLLSTLFNYPIIFESHAPKDFKNPLLSFFFNYLLNNKQVKRIVVITEALERYYKEHHPKSSQKLFVAPDGADPFPGNAKKAMIQDNIEGFKVGYVGSLYPGKGLEVVVKLAPACPTMSFHIVGGNDTLVASWKKRTAGINNLFFYGFVEPNSVPSYINSFNVVLLPNQNIVQAAPSPGMKSKSDIGRWTSPLKMFEYMAAGKPIVASDLEVIREILCDQKNALLVPPEDINAWKNALETLRRNKELAQRIGQTAKEAFLTNYSWQRRSEKVLFF